MTFRENDVGGRARVIWSEKVTFKCAQINTSKNCINSVTSLI